MIGRLYLGTCTLLSLYVYKKYTHTNDNLNKKTLADYPYKITQPEKKALKILKEKNIRPVVVSLYDSDGGTYYTDLMISLFEKSNIKVIKVSPYKGLNHSIFKKDNKIHGIFLPGGPNIGQYDEERKALEIALINKAQVSDIPLLGVCRGNQIIGYNHGLNIGSIDEFRHHSLEYRAAINPETNNIVIVAKGSQLYNALQDKIQNSQEIPEKIEYSISCLHHQGIQIYTSSQLKISGHSKSDNQIESVEISTGKYYTVGLQHHPEKIITAYNDEKKWWKIRTDKTKEIKAARAEYGFFTKQVKKKFLEDKDQKIKELEKQLESEQDKRCQFALYIS